MMNETYTYDAVGNLLTKTDRNGQTITYSYDNLDRLTTKQYPDSTAVSYVYDALSRLTQVTDPTGTYGFTYDNVGRLTQTATSYSFVPGQTFTLQAGYDAASNRTSMTDPQNGVTHYVYDTLNRVTSLTNPQGQQFSFSYDALSRRTQMTRPNGITANYQYDSVSRLLSVLHQTRRATLDGATYTYDPVGNRLSRQDNRTGVTSSFTYDALYELTQVAQGSTVTESYSYDAVGNRLSSLGVSPYSYNSSNELLSKPGVSFTYDNNGNMLSKTDSTGTTAYGWDFENRLTSVTLPGSGGTVSFKYDPFGRRIYKSSASGTSIYAYDDDNLIEEANGAGAVVARYAPSLAIDEPLAMLRSGTTSYFERDGVGTVTSLSNSAGALAETYALDSFGNQTASSGSLTNSFQFASREFDSETTLYYMRARYFDPATGRFLSEDPISFEGRNNFYAYTRNSPINFRDPQGWEPEGCTDCKGNPTQGLDAGKKCCNNTAPMSSSTNPNPYSPCETYIFINAGEMYRHGGDGSWGQLVRSCLGCMKSHGATPHDAHMFCYWNSAKRVSTPWNLGLPAVGGLARAVGGAVAILPKEFLPISTGGSFTLIYMPCMATK